MEALLPFRNSLRTFYRFKFILSNSPNSAIPKEIIKIREKKNTFIENLAMLLCFSTVFAQFFFQTNKQKNIEKNECKRIPTRENNSLRQRNI